MCAAANSWNADAKAKILPTYLKGLAYAVYHRLTAEQKASYDVLATVLKETFLPGTGERRRLARTQFSERSLCDGEALQVYARELEDLLDRAMPGLAEDLREQQLIDRFVESLLLHARYQLDLHPQVTFQGTIVRTRELMLLNDRQRQRSGHKFVSVSAACANRETRVIKDLKERLNEMEKALSTEGVSATSDNRQSGSGELPVTQDVHHTSTGRGLRCFLCNEQGHMKRNCPHRSMQKHVGHCFKCNQMDHLMRDCPIIQQTKPQMTTRTQQQQQYMYAQPDYRKHSTTGGKAPRRGVRSVSGALISSVIVTGCVDEMETSFLIDNGSLVSLLPRSLVGDKSTSSSGTRLQLKTVDGSSLKSEGAGKVLVRLAAWVCSHQLMVADVDMPILGADFLLDHGMIINMAKCQLDWIGCTLPHNSSS